MDEQIIILKKFEILITLLDNTQTLQNRCDLIRFNNSYLIIRPCRVPNFVLFVKIIIMASFSYLLFQFFF